MARLHDSNGKLLGGLNTSPAKTPLESASQYGRSTMTPEAAVDSAQSVPQSPQTSQKFAEEETVPGLECFYGTFAYDYSNMLDMNVSEQSQNSGCHNPIEDPDERHYCPFCGGYYCSVHSERAAHDCESVKTNQASNTFVSASEAAW